MKLPKYDKKNKKKKASGQEQPDPQQEAAEAAPDSRPDEGAKSPAGDTPPEPTPEEQIGQLKDKIIRLQADFDNSRKRLEREKSEVIRYANESLLESLLPIIDNFNLGLQAAEQGGDAKSIAMGMEMVRNQIEQFLHDHEVREVEASIGSPFDHNLHEAVRQEASEEHPEGSIIALQRKGYQLRERLLRPAHVVVAHSADKEAPADPS
jgi:molecular chaperone GrpE